jgi:general secretion pathway protein D
MVRSVKKVPFLGSIPIIGWLFRDTSTIKQKTNLLLFLTPYIIRDEADYRRIYEKKRKEQQDFVEAFYGRQPSYDVAIDFGRKSGPYGRLRREVLEETSKVENGGKGGPGDRLVTPADAAGTVGPSRPPAEPVPHPPPVAPPEPAGPDAIEVQPDLPDGAEPPAASPAPGGAPPSSPPASPSPPPGGAPAAGPNP